MGERCINGLGGKPEEKRPRHEWDNNKMDPQEVVCGSMDLIDMA
jgi:hypothetical protein